jgi:hypothetical protein
MRCARSGHLLVDFAKFAIELISFEFLWTQNCLIEPHFLRTCVNFYHQAAADRVAQSLKWTPWKIKMTEI